MQRVFTKTVSYRETLKRKVDLLVNFSCNEYYFLVRYWPTPHPQKRFAIGRNFLKRPKTRL